MCHAFLKHLNHVGLLKTNLNRAIVPYNIPSMHAFQLKLNTNWKYKGVNNNN
jgi:hypothetical protein